VAATLTQSFRGLALPLAAVLMIGVLGALALTETDIAAPREATKATFEGILAAEPANISRIEIASGSDRYTFRRENGGAWKLEQRQSEPLPPDLAAHLQDALQFMHVSEPARRLGPGEYQTARFGDYGLDPPASVVSLNGADRSFVADFGALSPAGTSQYVRVLGQPTLYLLPRHIGEEWQVAADMAKRWSPPEAPQGVRSVAMLLPASMDQVWAVEVLVSGQLHRLERDDAGNWLRHMGQHAHADGQRHVADPAQAAMISKALDAFGNTQIESVIARHPGPADFDRYGLGRPQIVAVMYARDASAPLARIEIGDKDGDGFSRGARLAPNGDLVTIADYEAQRLIALLRALGAIS
jgi:hypothetical protein